MLIICFVAPYKGVQDSAARARLGYGDYALLVTVSLSLGAFCAWLMYAVGGMIYTRVRFKSEAMQEWCGGALHFLGLIWIVSVMFLGEWLSSAILRLVH